MPVSGRLLGVMFTVALAGCVALPRDQGLSEAQRLVLAHSGRGLPAPGSDPVGVVSGLLSAPLTADTAVQLALVANPAVRREAARLGFAAAELYDAGRLANPVFSAARLSPGDAGAPHAQLTLGIAFNFLNLLLLPANTRYAGARFEAARLDFAAAVLDLAAQVEASYYQAAGAEQLAQLRAAVARAARASADLAQRYFDAGNISRRELAMEQAAASTATLAEISARAEAVATRSQLNRLMGLTAAQNAWSLDARLAALLPTEDQIEDLQRLSLDRLDVASLRRQAQAIADRYGITRRTRWVGGIEIGAQRERDYDGSRHTGPTLALELPLFNRGGGRVAAIRAALDQAEAELDARVLDVSNEVQLGAARVAAARALAEQYRSALIPQREAVVAQAQLEQNYMLIGVFELLLARQQAYDAYAGYIEAVRDYWIARAELTRAVGSTLPSSRQPAIPALDPAVMLRPQGGGMDHAKHSMGGMKGMEGHHGMDMKNMPGMDHSPPGKPATAEPGSRSGADDAMGDMPMQGMDHGNGSGSAPAMEAVPTEAGPQCATMKDMNLSRVDPSVARAMQEQCTGAGISGTAADAAVSGPDPHAGHDTGSPPLPGRDPELPHGGEPTQKSEAPHAH